MITETFATTRRGRSPRHVGPLANTFGVASRVGAPRRVVALCEGGFTLAELLVSMFVLGIILVMFAQLMTTATAVSRIGNKYIDTDTQARVVFDRMALDFAQMLKRTDVDYYIKGPVNYTGHGNGHGWGKKLDTGMQGSDQIALFSQLAGYYPSGAQSPLSLVAYRVNQSSASNPAYLKLERMSKGLLWNGADNGTNLNNANTVYPIVFLPQTISGIANGGKMWYAAVNNDGSSKSNDSDYETIGPGVFRLEYYYLLKNGRLTDVPWDRVDMPNQTSLTNPVNIGLTQIEAIGVTIAVIDPAGLALINAANANSLLDLASDLDDFVSAHGRGVGNQTKYIGMMEADWKGVVEMVVQTGRTSSGTPVPPEAAKAIRVYTRYFDLKSL
jgi:prepilin-type N-terminal cleavage/methylation domain-containing protein